MNEVEAYALALAAAAVGLWALVLTVRERPFDNPTFYAVAALEVALVAAFAGGVVALARTDRDVDPVLFVSYFVAIVLIPPAAVFWGVAEKSRWGTGVVVVAMVTVSVLLVRLLDIWTGRYV